MKLYDGYRDCEGGDADRPKKRGEIAHGLIARGCARRSVGEVEVPCREVGRYAGTDKPREGEEVKK